jgi:hypothetical protein
VVDFLVAGVVVVCLLVLWVLVLAAMRQVERKRL